MTLTLTDEQLDTVAKAAAVLMRPFDIAILIGLDSDGREEFLRNIRACSDLPYVNAYLFARATAQYDLHSSVVKLALKGSPAAQPIAEQYLKDQEL